MKSNTSFFLVGGGEFVRGQRGSTPASQTRTLWVAPFFRGKSYAICAGLQVRSLTLQMSFSNAKPNTKNVNSVSKLKESFAAQQSFTA